MTLIIHSLKTVQADNNAKRYFIDGKRVSKAAYENIRDNATLDCFMTGITPTKQGDKITQCCIARIYKS